VVWCAVNSLRYGVAVMARYGVKAIKCKVYMMCIFMPLFEVRISVYFNSRRFVHEQVSDYGIM